MKKSTRCSKINLSKKKEGREKELLGRRKKDRVAIRGERQGENLKKFARGNRQKFGENRPRSSKALTGGDTAVNGKGSIRTATNRRRGKPP